MNKKVVQLLKKARAKIEKPEAWAKGVQAKNADDESVVPYNPEAVCWCAAGAVNSFGYDEVFQKSEAITFLGLAIPKKFPHSVVTIYNDDPNTTHRKILNLFDRAIKLAEKAG